MYLCQRAKVDEFFADKLHFVAFYVATSLDISDLMNPKENVEKSVLSQFFDSQLSQAKEDYNTEYRALFPKDAKIIEYKTQKEFCDAKNVVLDDSKTNKTGKVVLKKYSKFLNSLKAKNALDNQKNALKTLRNFCMYAAQKCGYDKIIKNILACETLP